MTQNSTMPEASSTLRAATRADCQDIAKLFLISSDGLAAYIWGQMDADPTLSLEDIGAQRYAREGVAFSYQNCLITEVAGRVVGMAHAFVMPEGDGTVESDPILRPYAELEDPGSLYISGIALFPDYRGQGLGSRMLAACDAWARRAGAERLSLICFEGNRGALTLYQRNGYIERDRRAIVPHPTLHYDEGEALLLVKTLS